MEVLRKHDKLVYKGFILTPAEGKVVVYHIETDKQFNFMFKDVNSAKKFINNLL